MTNIQIMKARDEAKRFMVAVDRLLKAYPLKRGFTVVEYHAEYTKESATVKRASMDLTRALAEMRKNPWLR